MHAGWSRRWPWWVWSPSPPTTPERPRPRRPVRRLPRSWPPPSPPRLRGPFRAARACGRHVASSPRRAGIRSFALIDSRGRAVRLRAATGLRVGERDQGDAAGGLPARTSGGARPTAEEKALLGPMITRLRQRPGRRRLRAGWATPGLLRVARRAHMRHFATAGYWASASITALDQARFFLRVDRLVPKRNRAYARRLLASIVSYERWGFSRYAERAGYRAFFKGGWRGTASGRLVHEAALFQRGRTRFAMAVLTDGNPTHDYGTATLRGVAARIFARRARRGAHAARPRGRPCDARASRTCSTAPRASAWSLAYGSDRTTSPAGRCPATAARGPTCCGSAAQDLARVQRGLRRAGHGLLVLDAYRPGPRLAGARALGAPERAPGARGHLHRAAEPPQPRQRRGPDARTAARRAQAADGHGLRPPRAARAHARRAGPGAAQPARCSRRRWSGTASAATGASGGTSSTACKAPSISTSRWGVRGPHPRYSGHERTAPSGARPDRPQGGRHPRQRAQDRRVHGPRPRARGRRWWCSPSWRSPATRPRTCS